MKASIKKVLTRTYHEDGKGGFLYNSNDIDGFAQGMQRIYTNDISNMRNTNINTIKRFDTNNVNMKMTELYSSL